jgi:prepilin-type processing-associated H-X9-DG protein
MRSRNRNFATATIIVVGIIALVMIAKTALERMRMTAGRVPCASNLRQVGQALLLYAVDNGRVYPPGLEVLTVSDISPEVLHCADGGKAAPFVYLTPHGLMDDYGGDDPIAYEPASYHDGAGGNVLFGDGHVAFIESAALEALLARAATRPSSASQPTSAPVR